MKLYDYFKKQNANLFNELNLIEPLPFLDGDKSDEVNSLFMFKYGGRVLFSQVENLDVPQLAKMLYNLHGTRWKNLIDIENTDFDITSGTVRSVTESNDSNNVHNGNNLNINKVAAFDDVNMIDDTATDNTENSTDTKTANKIREEKSKSLYSSYMNLSLLEKNNIIDLVFDDVRNFISLSVY